MSRLLDRIGDWGMFAGIFLVGPLISLIDWPMMENLRYKRFEKAKPASPDWDPTDPFMDGGPVDARFVFENDDGYEVFLYVDPTLERLKGRSNILSRPHSGSGMMGVMILSAPMIPVWLPVILLVNGWFRGKEEFFDMSRRSCLLLRKVRSSMPSEDYDFLKRILRNEWNEGARY